ncbi:MAG: hypothetical protein KC457_22095, partial [Myxococcales bacterium]|nr:hypothetical protein [Myxococcales bacterium]
QPAVFDFDPLEPGADAIVLQGEGFGGWRPLPSVMAGTEGGDGTQILVLDSGLERVDLAAGTSEWLVPAETFAELGLTRLQLSAFDIDGQGRIWLAAAEPGFTSFSLWRIDLEGDTPQLIREVEGLHSVTGALEIIGDQAWFADTTPGASGLRVFDLSTSPVVELAGSPVAVGLPPMSLARL